MGCIVGNNIILSCILPYFHLTWKRFCRRGLAMQFTIPTIAFLAGLALIVVGIFGGGIEIQYLKIPQLAPLQRTFSFVAGCALMIMCLAFPQAFSWTIGPDKPPETTGSTRPTPGPPIALEVSKTSPWLGSAIKNKLITVSEVKMILRTQNMYSGSIDDEPTPGYFQAVAAFQALQNIDTDGYVGPATYAKLRSTSPSLLPKP
jgi:hypothetical protein